MISSDKLELQDLPYPSVAGQGCFPSLASPKIPPWRGRGLLRRSSSGKGVV